jgi:hypothetical protein
VLAFSTAKRKHYGAQIFSRGNGCAGTSNRHTLRRECLKAVIFSEMLRRILSAYAAYYNQAHTHLVLRKEAPLHRAVQRTWRHCGWTAPPIRPDMMFGKDR